MEASHGGEGRGWCAAARVSYALTTALPPGSFILALSLRFCNPTLIPHLLHGSELEDPAVLTRTGKQVSPIIWARRWWWWWWSRLALAISEDLTSTRTWFWGYFGGWKKSNLEYDPENYGRGLAPGACAFNTWRVPECNPTSGLRSPCEVLVAFSGGFISGLCEFTKT